ncbi:MAG: DMT family transporter [Burkholderiales bacterium]|nr:DMT family transporter [Burkholderiales bacterium]
MPGAGIPRGAALPVLALVANAFTWGVSWWPLRQLQALGLHPLWSTTLVFALATLLIGLRRPAAWRELARTPSLWVVLLAAGATNACFNWAVAIGDVVRVVLLFYLMPLWAVVLAYLLLGERPGAGALLRVALALGGAMIVLWPEQGAGWPLPRTLAEGLALLGGATFALNNVMLRREAGRGAAARALAMFVGGMLVSALLALAGSHALPPPAWGWMLGIGALSLAFLGGNLALQYGAAHLPANVTAVVMLTEVLFASVSSLLLGAGQLTPALVGGGALIILAALLAARR